MSSKTARYPAFSRVEILVVVIVLGVIAANTMPRFSRGSAGVADAALAGNLTILRCGIEAYASDHAGQFPALDKFDSQMTQYTDAAGNTATAMDNSHPYGPYLRKVPVLPVGPKTLKGSTGLADASRFSPGASAGAWLYNPSTGQIQANLSNSEFDSSGKQYNQY
jgi:type II secretory pathway pseudopilin PulG